MGRDRELAAIDDVLNGLAAGRHRFFEVHGEPGIGKTTLLTALTGGAGIIGAASRRRARKAAERQARRDKSET